MAHESAVIVSDCSVGGKSGAPINRSRTRIESVLDYTGIGKKMLLKGGPPMTLTHEPLSTTDNSFPEPHYPYDESHIGLTELMPTHRVDLRPDGPDVFHDADPNSGKRSRASGGICIRRLLER